MPPSASTWPRRAHRYCRRTQCWQKQPGQCPGRLSTEHRVADCRARPEMSSTTLFALDGWPVEVADTAGWRSTESPLEREGMARARQAMAGADLCLWLVDASAMPVWPHANLRATRIVINKTDLGPAWPLETVDAVRVSAQTGAGLAELCQAIANWLVPAVPPGLAAVPFTVEQVAALAEVKALVNTGNLREALGRLDKMPGVRLTKPGC